MESKKRILKDNQPSSLMPSWLNISNLFLFTLDSNFNLLGFPQWILALGLYYKSSDIKKMP